ncbi:MAG: TetR/AcrR family transcriptional regulator [Proteobacteria bacterium]|nr:TetR/AcrR family transcriptional regulator [Pseudomonadota bacterium]
MVAKKIQGEQTKEKLLGAAFEVLKTKGVKSLTASQIVEAAGISKGGFFHHFSTIEDFNLYMLDQIIRMFESQLFEVEHENLRGFLEHSMHASMQMIEETPEILSIIYHFIDLGRFNPIYMPRLQNLMKMELNKMSTDMSGYFPKDLPEEKRMKVVYMLDIYFAGLGTHYMVLKDKDLYLDITRDFITMIINYVEGNTNEN